MPASHPVQGRGWKKIPLRRRAGVCPARLARPVQVTFHLFVRTPHPLNMTRRRISLKDVRRGLQKKERGKMREKLSGKKTKNKKWHGWQSCLVAIFRRFHHSIFYFSPPHRPRIRCTVGMIKTLSPTAVCGGLGLLRVIVVVGRNNEILLTQFVRDNNV